MANYLGGINDPGLEIAGVKAPGLFGFEFSLIFHDNTGKQADREKELSINETIIRYEEVTSESEKDYSLTWGVAGYLFGGALGAALGTLFSGNRRERHVVLCELNNGWQFALELNKTEFHVWNLVMPDAVKENTGEGVQ